MIAAIYARKSTEQAGVATDAKSVTRQVELARVFAQSKGWSVDDRYVFVDDGISGAEFERRPGFMQMMGHLKPAAPFRALIVSEQKSIGRESSQTQYTIKQLAEAGVEVYSYMEGSSLTPKTWLDKAMSSIRAAADEAHREDTSKRVKEAHAAKHQRGYVVGGRVFGYRNQDEYRGEDSHGRPLRSHVVRVIDENEAVVVREIFELYASGYGLKKIARLLNDKKARAPKPFNRKHLFGLPAAEKWVPSTVGAVLRREDYRGVYVWNRSMKRDSWGKARQRPRDPSEWKRAEVPKWRIVSDALWKQAAARRHDVAGAAARFAGGRLSGRPPRHLVVNLLAGIATCGVCGRGMVAETYKTSPGKPRGSHYVCNHRRMYGTGAKGCNNSVRLSVTLMNEAVLQAIEEHALTATTVEQVIQLSERDDAQDQQQALTRERANVQASLARLVKALAEGADAPSSIVAKVRELEAIEASISHQLASIRPVPRLEPAVLEGRLAEWRRMLRQSNTQARTVLERVLAGRIVFTPMPENTYSFQAPTRFDRLFAGLAAPRPAGWQQGDTRGTEHIDVEDTLEGDYGRLLERAYARLASNRKGVASPPGQPILYLEGPLAP